MINNNIKKFKDTIGELNRSLIENDEVMYDKDIDEVARMTVEEASEYFISLAMALKNEYSKKPSIKHMNYLDYINYIMQDMKEMNKEIDKELKKMKES